MNRLLETITDAMAELEVVTRHYMDTVTDDLARNHILAAREQCRAAVSMVLALREDREVLP